MKLPSLPLPPLQVCDGVAVDRDCTVWLSLLICCSAFRFDTSQFEHLTVRKIP